MSAASDKRIADIRSTVREERVLLSELNSRISVDLRNALKPASIHLDDVEGFFLAPETLRHPTRSEREMAKWLDQAETVLHRAVTHREWIERLIAKYGTDARMVGG